MGKDSEQQRPAAATGTTKPNQPQMSAASPFRGPTDPGDVVVPPKPKPDSALDGPITAMASASDADQKKTDKGDSGNG